MEQIKRNFTRIVFAQVIAFGLSWLAINYIFLGPLPQIRPHLKEDIQESPAKVYAVAKQTFTSIAQFTSFQARKNQEQSQNNQQSKLPPPWFGEAVPAGSSSTGTLTAAPTSSNPLPSLFQRPSESPTRQPSSLPNRPTQVPRPTATTTPIPEPTEPVNLAQMEQGILDEINRRRAASNIGRLYAQSQLTKAARNQANYLDSNGICPPSHTGEGCSSPQQRIKAAGYKGVPLGETLLCAGRTVQIAVDMWWSSTQHKMILTDRSATQAGVGWVDGYAAVVTGR